jgi:hypothetical protein
VLGPNNGAAVFSLREHKINEISATVISIGNSLRMAYTGVLKLLGAIAHWILGGFRVPFSEYCDENSDRPNFIAGLLVVFVLMMIVIPLLSNIF